MQASAATASSSSSSTNSTRLQNARASHRLLIGDTPHVSYTAANYGERAHHQSSFHRYAIGVVSASGSSSSTTVQLLEVPHVYVMSQTVKAVVQAEREAQEQAKTDAVPTSASFPFVDLLRL